MKKSILKRSVVLLLIFATVMALVFATACSCGGGEEDPDGGKETPDDSAVLSVTITKDGADAGDSLNVTYEEGLTMQLAATVEVKGNLSESVRWTSSDYDIASVARTGLVTFKGIRGEVVITAASSVDPSMKDTITITVEVPYESVITIDKGGIYRFEAELADMQGSDTGDTGSTTGTIVESNPDASGGYNIGNFCVVGNTLVFALTSNAPAKARLTLCLANPTSNASNVIDLDNAADITWNDEKLTTGINVYTDRTDVKPWFDYKEYECETTVDLKEGLNVLAFEVLYDTGGDESLRIPNFDYIDFDVIEYDGAAVEGAVSSVTITYDGKAAADTMEVNYNADANTMTFGADVLVSGSASKDVTWTSDKEDIAIVADGVVTLKGVAGEVTITATSAEDAEKSDSVKINVSVWSNVVTEDGTYRIEGEAADLGDSTPGQWGPLVETPSLPEGVTLSGGQNLGNMNVPGNTFTYTLNSNGTGKVTLKFRLSRKDEATPIDEAATFKFNNVEFDAGITVPAADEESGLSSWFQYDVYECVVEFDLVAGANTLVIEIISDEEAAVQMVNIDYIEFTVTGYAAA